MKEKEINMILVGDKLMNYSRFINDGEGNYFLKHYKQFGLIKRNIPDSGIEVLMDKIVL
jgi:hypothetical protein